MTLQTNILFHILVARAVVSADALTFKDKIGKLKILQQVCVKVWIWEKRRNMNEIK